MFLNLKTFKFFFNSGIESQEHQRRLENSTTKNDFKTIKFFVEIPDNISSDRRLDFRRRRPDVHLVERRKEERRKRQAGGHQRRRLLLDAVHPQTAAVR